MFIKKSATALLVLAGIVCQTTTYGFSTLSTNSSYRLLPISEQVTKQNWRTGYVVYQQGTEPGENQNLLPSNKAFIEPNLGSNLMPEQGHPRKKLLEKAVIDTERAWLYSAIIPGLGQIYNQNYWRLPLIYGVFAGLIWGAVYNHNEYKTAKKEFIQKNKELKEKKKGKVKVKDISGTNLGNFMTGRKRDRTIFIVAIGVWHLINIFDAYVGGSLKTFDISDDLAVVVKPAEPDTKNPGIGLSFGLHAKDQPKVPNL